MTTKEQITENVKDKLVLISGATRGIGKAFADHYRSQNIQVIGIGRSEKPDITRLDLYNENAARELVEKLDLENVREIIYMHTIGIDKFEPDGKPHIDRDGDGIDDEIYASNVTAFSNLADPLIEKTRIYQTPMTIVNIGSISDSFGVPFWQSFSRSKNTVRKNLRSMVAGKTKSVFLNVSSTLDEDKNKYGRTYANTSYWQTADELVSKSIRLIEGMREMESGYLEADFYKPDPNFRPDYFTNLPKLFAIWQRDMGYMGKEIPHGIRI